MRSGNLMCSTLAALLAVAIVTPLAAQQQADKHHKYKYKVIDLGTFGGPQSYVNIPDDSYARVLNNHGRVTGWADTSTPDPYPGFCFDEDCFVAHAFQWRNGVRTDLGTLPGGASSQSNWISESGLIAGLSENGAIDPLIPGFPELRAVLWEHGKITDLGTLDGGYESAANAVNSRRQVVGAALNTIPDADSMFGLGYQARAFLWQDGAMQDLGTLGGTDAIAFLVNERGQVVGDSYTSSDPSAYCSTFLFPLTTGAFLWEKGSMVNLGNFGGTCTFAFALNNRGQVVGGSSLAGDQVQHPFLWDRGSILDLGTFGGDVGTAIAINDPGAVVGYATYPGDQVFHAFLWRHGKKRDLGTLAGDSFSFGFDINARGQVVGSSSKSDFSQFRAFLWEDGGPIVDLNALIPANSALYLTIPDTINDRGEIAGVGLDANGDEHAFLLVPCGPDDTEGCQDAAAGTSTTRIRQVPAAQQGTNPVRQLLRKRLGFDRFVRSPPKAALNGNAAIAGPIATLSPTSLTFSAQGLDTRSPAKTVTVKNTGNASLTITAIAITGTNAGDFAQTDTCGSSLAPGASCGISVTFKPTASGTRMAVLTVTDNAAGSPQQVPLSGIGTTAKLSPTTLSFGTVAIGTASPAKTVTLTNVGTTTLTITAIAITGTNAGDFAQTQTCGSSLAAGASCTVSVTFKPTQIGKRTGTLSVTDNAPGSPQKVTLSGIGTTAQLSPTSLDFGSVAVGTTSPAKTVTLTNVGTTTLSITGIAITGTNAGDFAQTNTCGSSLAAGASCTVSVTFKPSAKGSLSGILSVTDNAPGSPQTVSLSGTGTAGFCSRTLCGGPLPPCCPGLTCQFRGMRTFCVPKTPENTSRTSSYWDVLSANKLE